MIAVTFALPTESADFIKLLDQRVAQTGGVAGRLGSAEVHVLHTGVGEAASSRTIAKFLAAHSPDLLFCSGFAGALTKELAVADLLVAQNFTSPELLDVVRGALGARAQFGTLATATSITDSAAERAALATRSGAIAVDMETESIAAACDRAAVPLVALRAISDTPAAPLPAPPHVLFDVATQRTPFAALSLHVVRHPGALFRLLAFARQIAAAREQLTDALAALVRHPLVTSRR